VNYSWTGGSLLGLLLAVAACGDRQRGESVGAERAAIVGGAATSAYPEVGILGVTSSYMMCTGVLVAPKVLLTAGHCLHGGTAYGFYTGPGSSYTGSTVSQATLDALPNTNKHEVASSGVYPGANFTATPFQYDVAYVVLRDPILDIAPATLGTAPPGAGTVCTVVGYGWDDLTTPRGLYKKSATVQVQGVDAYNIETVETTGAPTHGDSGGPMYCAGAAVSVFSWCDYFASATSVRREARIDGTVGTWLAKILAENAVLDAGADGATGDGAAPAVDAGSPSDSDAGASAPAPGTAGGPGGDAAAPSNAAHGESFGCAVRGSRGAGAWRGAAMLALLGVLARRGGRKQKIRKRGDARLS
jgi:hypothetical protein